jgi:23S rRNA pseudouridine1911/1915/1917 synthase
MTRLDRWLSSNLPQVSRSQIQRDLNQGLILVDGLLRPAGYRVREGQNVEYSYSPRPDPEIKPEPMDLEVPYEDAHLAVINKKAGLVVHPGAGHAQGTLVNALVARYGQAQLLIGGENRCGLIHRLDAQTSGLMVVAREEPVWNSLIQLMADRTISRKYLGLSPGYFRDNEGMIDQPIGRRKKDRKKMGVVPEGKDAITHWRVLSAQLGISLLGLRLHTGRTHQIRVHLQFINRSILGDPDYGTVKNKVLQNIEPEGRKILAPLFPKRQMLHAVSLKFPHPGRDGEPVHATVGPPEDMMRIIQETMPENWEEKLDAWLAEPESTA